MYNHAGAKSCVWSYKKEEEVLQTDCVRKYIFESAVMLLRLLYREWWLLNDKKTKSNIVLKTKLFPDPHSSNLDKFATDYYER